MALLVLVLFSFFGQQIIAQELSSSERFALFISYSPLHWLGQGYPTTPDAEHPNTDGIRASGLRSIAGFGVAIPLARALTLHPAIELTFDEYVFKPSIGKAFPTFKSTGSQVEQNAAVASVMGLFFQVPLNFVFVLNESINLELGPGLNFYFLIPTQALDGSENIERIGDYLNKDLRWFYPSVHTSVSFDLDTLIQGAFRIRAFLPLWQAWSGDGLPFYDHLMLDLSFLVRFKL